MASWIAGALEKTAGVRAAAYEKTMGAVAAGSEMAAGAATYATATGEAMKTTDVRTMAANGMENATAMAAGAREGAGQRVAGASAMAGDAFNQANARAYTMEGRMRMEAAVAADYAASVKYKGDRVVKQKIRGHDGPPMADEVVEMMNEMAKEIRIGSNKGRRIAYLRKWAKELDDDLTYEEIIDDGNKDGEPEPEPEADTDEAAVARQERLKKLQEDAAGTTAIADFKADLAKAATFQERMAIVRKQAYEASIVAAAKAAELDEYYKIRENAAVYTEIAKVQAGEYAVATKESLKQRTENYREGKGFTVEIPEGMQRVRVVTVMECFMRSEVVDCLIVSFLKEPATTGSESVRCFATILKHCLHGSDEFAMQVAEGIAVTIPPVLRGRDSKKSMQEQLTTTLKVTMVDHEIEAIRVNLNSNRNAAKALREEIAKLEAAADSDDDSNGAGRIAKVLSLSKDLIDINMEEVSLTSQQHDLLEAKATVYLGDHQSECDKVIAAVKEQYTEQGESVRDQKATIVESAGQTMSEKEAAEMEFQETDAKIQAELDKLRAREAELKEELATLEGSISTLETQRATAAAARDGTAAKVGSEAGKIALTESQLGVSELNVQLEMRGVEEVEKLLDDTFDEVSRAVKEMAAGVGATTVQLSQDRLTLLEAHVGFVKTALVMLQKKIAFCASELNERIEKRESMIKMGMENVADSLIPGFDKLEEKFVELVQSMKSVLGDFEPLQKQVEEATAGTLTDNVELRAKIGEGLAAVLELKVALETAASSLEGRIEMEEVKWRGDAAPAAPAAAPAAGGAAPDVDSIVADLAPARD